MKTSLSISSSILVAALATTHPASADESPVVSVDTGDDVTDTSGQPAADKDETGAAMDVLGAAVPDGAGPYTIGKGEMYGVRASVHERVSRRFAIDVGMGGSIASHRYDLAWDIPDVLVYMTPRSKLQLYTVTGMELRVSHLESATNTFFSGVFGIGIETRLSKTTAMRFDLRGLLPINRPDDAPYAPRALASVGFVFF